MTFLKDLSIKKKLTLAIAFSSLIALVTATIAFIIHDSATTRSKFQSRIETQAKIIANNIVTAILFDDKKTGEEILSSLNADHSIVLAHIHLPDGSEFIGNKKIHANHNKPLTNSKHIFLVQEPVIYNKNPIATVVIHADDSEIATRAVYFTLISLLVLFFSLLNALFFSKRFQKLIYTPILHLAKVSKQVSENQDYNIRATKFDNDELGELTEDFNEMLEHIQLRDQNLESLVNQRTEELKLKNHSLNLEISERKKAQELLEESETRFKNAFYNAGIGMVLVNKAHKISQVNNAFCHMLGYKIEELMGKSFRDITYKDDIEISIERHQKLLIGEIYNYQIEKRYLHKNGNIIWGLLNVSSVRDHDNQFVYAIAQIQDITESHKLSNELNYQATHDSLTNLFNRREFERRLNQAVDSIDSNKIEHVLCYIDLDQFKIINDSCGHTAGDELLRQTSKIMQDNIRHNDTLARLGGDEFGILMEHCSLEQAMRVVNKIRTSLEEYRFIWTERNFSIGASIGLTPVNQNSMNSTELMKQADAACYAAKDAGRNRIHTYHEEDDKLAQRHGEIQWVEKINNALAENRFHLYAQPIVHTQLDETHYELLLRMEDEEGNIIAPGSFLMSAERYNLIAKLDRWVLDAAFFWLEQVNEGNDAINFCSINLSGQNLGDEEFRNYILHKLENSNIPKSMICFEITETAAIANLTDATNFIIKLKEQGCLFALDDFGSGVSSFAYLKNLPVDYLKIDGMFVKDILDDPIDLAMVKSINEIGHVMGKKTIAEFVENEMILKKLQEIGVDYAQGYGIGMPEPLEFISNQKKQALKY